MIRGSSFLSSLTQLSSSSILKVVVSFFPSAHFSLTVDVRFGYSLKNRFVECLTIPVYLIVFFLEWPQQVFNHKRIRKNEEKKKLNSLDWEGDYIAVVYHV